jgi:hypothetical protein
MSRQSTKPTASKQSAKRHVTPVDKIMADFIRPIPRFVDSTRPAGADSEAKDGSTPPHSNQKVRPFSSRRLNIY